MENNELNVAGDVAPIENSPVVTTDPIVTTENVQPVKSDKEGLLSYSDTDNIVNQIKAEAEGNFKNVAKVSDLTWNSLHSYGFMNLNGQLKESNIEVLKGAVEDGKFSWQ